MRIVQYQTATIRTCDACGGSHGSMKLYDVVAETAVSEAMVAPKGTFSVFLCPNKDNTVVLFERVRMEEAEPDAPKTTAT